MKSTDLKKEAAMFVEQGLRTLANAITPLNASPYDDEHGGHVASLTEAVIGVSTSLNRIADALFEIAGSLKDKP